MMEWLRIRSTKIIDSLRILNKKCQERKDSFWQILLNSLPANNQMSNPT